MKSKNDKKTEEMQKQIDELNNNWKRALADYQNLVKRTNEEKEAFSKFANIILLLKLLPVIDTLEKTFEHTEDEGVKLALKQFKEALKESGVTEIDVLNKEFDPKTSECIEVIQGEDDNKVVEVLINGYMIYDKVLRPAKVKVSKKNVQGEGKDTKTTSSYKL